MDNPSSLPQSIDALRHRLTTGLNDSLGISEIDIEMNVSAVKKESNKAVST